MIYVFENYALDPDRRELRRGADLVAVEPQVFDLLHYLIRSRERVVSKDDMIATVWNGRIVSESALTSRLTAARHAVGDSGEQQRLIRTFPRKGHRFVGTVCEERRPAGAVADAEAARRDEDKAAASTPVVDSAERRHLTIMVCDVIGSAALARLDPEDLRQVKATCLGCVGEVVESYGGFVAEDTAEGILVHFGYPQAHEDDAERAVRAGLALARAVADLKIPGLTRPVQPRIGIATGVVVIGDLIRPGALAKHAAVGETPHLAARLLAAADPGAVVISAGTRRLIGSLFDCTDMGGVALKGVPDPIAAFRVVRESAIASRFHALRSSRTELIGRDEELGLLLRRWHQAKAGEGRVALIWGEPGIGKSRLVAAVEDAVREEPHASMSFYCSPHRTQTALYPVASQIERAAGFAPDDDNRSKLDKLKNMLVSFSGDLDRDTALYAGLLSIAVDRQSAEPSSSPQRRKELLFERFVAQLTGIAAHRPVLMILEDAHWIDPTTRDLFDLVIEQVRGLPVLFVMTYRPEFSPPWIGQSHVMTLTLNRLGRRENAAVIRRVAGDKELPAILLEQIISRTDGVPLFIEEMTKSVLESDVLREEDGTYVLAGSLPALAVPATLRASLAARIDRLASVRSVVQAGAALGREFAYPVLKAVMQLGDGELGPLLGQLVASELVHQRGAIPHAVYTFKHALVQDAAHETMLKGQRIQLHARIIEVLEQEFAEAPRRNPDVLAYHCTEAGLREKAIDYWLKAARMALDRSAGIEAQAQVETGMALVREIPQGPFRRRLEGRLQVALADTLIMTKGFASPEVAATLSRARALLDGSGQPAESLRALCGLFNYHLMRSESPQGLKLASPLLEQPLERPTATIVHYLVGAAHLHMGSFHGAQRHLEESLSLYDEEACRPLAFVGGYHVHSFALIWLGLARLYVGALERGRETILAAVSDARRRSHPFTLVSALLALARFLVHVGDVRAAIDATEEGNAIATEQRSPYHISRASVLRAVNLIESGQPQAGITLMHRALDAHRETGANYQSSFNLSYLALAHSRAGDHQRAFEIATQAADEVERTGERWWEAEAHRIRGEVILSAAPADSEEAEACFRRALECARRQAAKLWELRAEESLARVGLVAGKPGA